MGDASRLVQNSATWRLSVRPWTSSTPWVPTVHTSQGALERTPGQHSVGFLSFYCLKPAWAPRAVQQRRPTNRRSVVREKPNLIDQALAVFISTPRFPPPERQGRSCVGGSEPPTGAELSFARNAPARNLELHCGLFAANGIVGSMFRFVPALQQQRAARGCLSCCPTSTYRGTRPHCSGL